MAARQDCGQDTVDYVLLTHNPLAHLALEPSDGADQALQLLNVVVSGGLSGGHVGI
jgi:hypothetical protein